MAKRSGYRWPEHFTIGVIKKAGIFTADAIKQWTSLLSEDTGMKVHFAYTLETAKADKLKWVRHSMVELTDGGSDEVNQMLSGERRCADRDSGPFQVRSVWMVSKYDGGFMVRGDSHIRGIYDIKTGVRIVDTRGYLVLGQRNVDGLLAWAKIKDPEKDVQWIQAYSTEEKAQLITEGKADIAFAVPSASVTIQAEKNPHGLRWIDLNAEKDPEGAKRFHEKYRLIDLAPMFRGVASARGHWGTVGADQFCCRADADVEFIYHLAKWLDENYPRYKNLHYWLEHTTRQNLMKELDKTFIPCHDGLIKYLKELGLWTLEHEKRQQRNVALVTRYCEASREAMWLADKEGVVVSADNPKWVELWAGYKKEMGLPQFDYLPSLGRG